MEEVFDLQDRITEAVIGAIEPSLRVAEIERARAKPTNQLGAYDLYLRALSLYERMSEDMLRGAIRVLDQALSLDPDRSMCYTTLGYVGDVGDQARERGLAALPPMAP